MVNFGNFGADFRARIGGTKGKFWDCVCERDCKSIQNLEMAAVAVFTRNYLRIV